MKYIAILATLLLLGACALSAGCTSPTQAGFPPAVTPAVPVQVTASPPAPVVAATPIAVETLPEEQFVDLQLTKERPDFTIHLLYNGGKGQAFVQNILMAATLSDGTVVQKYMDDETRQPRQGDELVIQGSRGSDRVEVYVTSAGRTYKVLDKLMTTTSL
jgi:hypothetical protein